jgi:tRNA threonylcarbamoyl adenosine modification protein YeaZ
VLALAFDTSTAAVTVALCEWASGGAVRVRAMNDTTDRRHAEFLAPSIAGVLAEGGAVARDLDLIVVGAGPGPYTGLRVGLATAHAMADALGVLVHGVCSLDAIAWAAGLTEPFVVASDARRKEVYWARYDSYQTRAGEPQVGPPEDAAAAGLPVVGEGSALYPAVLGGPREPLLPSAVALAEVAAHALSEGRSLPIAEPLYLRRPDAREPAAPKKVSQPLMADQ